MRDKTIVVLGAAGGVGEGVVAELLRAGARVLAISRTDAKLDQLADRLGRPSSLALIAGGVGSEEEASTLAQSVKRSTPRTDGVVVSIGSWWQGPPLIQTLLADWNSVLTERLTTHFLAAKHFIPLVAETAPGGFYLSIGGATAEVPVPNSGPVSVASAAQVMLTKVLQAEAGNCPVRIQELMIWTTIATRVHGGKVDPSWITPNDVGRHIVALMASAAGARDPIVHLRSRSAVGKVG
jgi:NAD(P)-dependent dehydrogenase (short-subunit alcohol dehydrogenase family)